MVDAHLDLAYNASRGRDPRMPASQQPVVENEIATVGLPDLREGGVGLICATIFCEPISAANPRGYTNAEEARSQALIQFNWYRSCIDEGLLSIAPLFHPDSTRIVLLLEGADALRTPADVAEWHAAGLRIVGLSWKRTRYAGGTGAPGSLTAEGRSLVKELDRFNIIHDTSHLAEESFWNLLDATNGPVIASHSNCRTIVGEGDRHLTDDMIRAIVKRNGVIGINFFDKFLLPTSQYKQRRATLADVVNHIKHICDLAGDAKHVGLGTDMDGGLGREQIPVEIRTSADLPRVAAVLSAAGFSDEDVVRIMAENWLWLFEAHVDGH